MIMMNARADPYRVRSSHVDAPHVLQPGCVQGPGHGQDLGPHVSCSLLLFFSPLSFRQGGVRKQDAKKLGNVLTHPPPFFSLYMPYSARYLEADQGALPTGEILTAAPGSINDFASAPGLALGHARDQPGFEGNCGADGACEGYNGYFLIEGAPRDAVVVSLASAFSGIRADLRTDQPGVVLYSCNWFDGSAPLKASTQGLPGRDAVTRSSCVAIEAQDYVDGINQYVPPPPRSLRVCVVSVCV